MGAHPRIKVNEDQCVGCCRCQLICSLVHAGAFSLEQARLVVQPGKEISFTKECLRHCVLCTQYCPTGALEVQPAAAAGKNFSS